MVAAAVAGVHLATFFFACLVAIWEVENQKWALWWMCAVIFFKRCPNLTVVLECLPVGD